MKYPAHFLPDTGGFVVTFRDLPEAITQGDDEADAMFMAADALLCAIEFYFDDKRIVPAPSKPQKGERMIELPPSIAAKVLLLNEMLSQNVRASDLARRMNTTPQEVNRLIDLKHTTKIDRIAEALSALGRHLEVAVI